MARKKLRPYTLASYIGSNLEWGYNQLMNNSGNDRNSNNVSKRLYLNLEYIQGEEVYLEFDIVEDCEAVLLSDYTFSGDVIEEFNDTPVASFTFVESKDTPLNQVATISGADTLTLVPKRYEYEIRMEHAEHGRPEVILYGTLDIKPTRR